MKKKTIFWEVIHIVIRLVCGLIAVLLLGYAIYCIVQPVDYRVGLLQAAVDWYRQNTLTSFVCMFSISIALQQKPNIVVFLIKLIVFAACTYAIGTLALGMTALDFFQDALLQKALIIVDRLSGLRDIVVILGAGIVLSFLLMIRIAVASQSEHANSGNAMSNEKPTGGIFATIFIVVGLITAVIGGIAYIARTTGGLFDFIGGVLKWGVSDWAKCAYCNWFLTVCCVAMLLLLLLMYIMPTGKCSEISGWGIAAFAIAVCAMLVGIFRMDFFNLYTKLEEVLPDWRGALEPVEEWWRGGLHISKANAIDMELLKKIVMYVLYLPVGFGLLLQWSCFRMKPAALEIVTKIVVLPVYIAVAHVFLLALTYVVSTLLYVGYVCLVIALVFCVLRFFVHGGADIEDMSESERQERLERAKNQVMFYGSTRLLDDKDKDILHNEAFYGSLGATNDGELIKRSLDDNPNPSYEDSELRKDLDR